MSREAKGCTKWSTNLEAHPFFFGPVSVILSGRLSRAEGFRECSVEWRKSSGVVCGTLISAYGFGLPGVETHIPHRNWETPISFLNFKWPRLLHWHTWGGRCVSGVNGAALCGHEVKHSGRVDSHEARPPDTPLLPLNRKHTQKRRRQRSSQRVRRGGFSWF